MSVFEAAFSVPAGHGLREVRRAPRARRPHRGIWEWEHEEHDEHHHDVNQWRDVGVTPVRLGHVMFGHDGNSVGICSLLICSFAHC